MLVYGVASKKKEGKGGRKERKRAKGCREV